MKLSLGETLPINRQQANGKTGCIHAHHDRGERALWKPPQVRHRQIRNLSHVRIRVRTWLEVDLDEAHAGHRPRFHVIDSAAQREESFECIRDVRFDLLRRHAAVKRRHLYDRNVDRRKHIHGHLDEGGESQHAHEEANHDDEIWVA